MKSWSARTGVSAFVAVALAVVVLLLTLNWATILVAAAGVLAVLLAFLALQDGLPAGSCPTCRARPGRQRRHELSVVLDRSVPSNLDHWAVAVTVERLCVNCRESRTLVEEFHIARAAAGTEAEALVLARSGRYTPTRIRTA